MRNAPLPLLLCLLLVPACTLPESTADDTYVVRAVARTVAPPASNTPPEPPEPASPPVLPERVSLAPYVSASPATEKEVTVSGDADRERSSFRYDYRPATVYQIRTAVGFLTTVVFERGERILSRAAGDTDRWLVEEVPIGDGPDVQPTLIIKPAQSPLATNMVVTTNKRLYQLELIGLPPTEPYQSLVLWRYANSTVTAGRTWADLAGRSTDSAGSASAAEGVQSVDLPIDVRNLDFDYKISLYKTKRRPPWAPIQIFHDGSKTYIRFPDRVTQTEAPPFFVRQGEEDQIVNYRVIGDLYVVDRVVDIGILKIGEKNAQQVLISYAGDFFDERSRR